VREAMLKALLDELRRPGGDRDRRRLVAWVLGHANEEAALSELFRVADDGREASDLRAIAAFAWWRLGLARDVEQSRRAARCWPREVLSPTVTAFLDETMTAPHHAWTRTVLAARPDFPLPALVLGDHPDDPVAWVFLNAEELAALGLRDLMAEDVPELVALGKAWSMKPPPTFFGRQAMADAYGWAGTALRVRVARMRAWRLRAWEAWLLEALQKPTEPVPPKPCYTPVRLAQPRPQAEATTLLILGAFRARGFESDPVGMSSAVAASAAGLHATLSRIYEDAHRTAWHVAGLTGELELRLSAAGA